MKSKKSFLGLAGVCSVLLVINLAHAAPPPADQKLLITAVEVEHGDTLIIRGMNFTSGEHDPVVTLHEVGVLVVDDVTADTVIAAWPNGAIDPGDYLLSIRTSPAVVDNDTFALTIGGPPIGFTVGLGLQLNGNEVSVDASETQTRVSGECDAGAAIRRIFEDGRVECEVDSDTRFTAGFGLDLVGNEFSVDPAEFQRRIAVQCPAGWAINGIAMDGTPSCVEVQAP